MDIFTSKKFWASVAGLLAVVGGKFVGLPESAVEQVILLIGAYVVGQGLADVGKSAAQINQKK